jgi:N-acetylglutamate synthase-like GNAT family acetyltransferase
VHYIELQQAGAISVENVYLLTQEAPEYFLTPKSIVVQNQKDNPKYKEIYKINY